MRKFPQHFWLIAMISGLALIVPLAPAHAGSGGPDPSLLSRFFPTYGATTVATDSISSYVWQDVTWNAAADIAHLRDSDSDAYEQEVTLFTDSGCWGSGYERGSWDSDYPAAYLDVLGNDDSRPNYAVGTGRSNLLATGRNYYHWLRLEAGCGADGYPYVVKGQESHKSGSCSGGYEWCVYADSGSPRDIIPYISGFETGPRRAWFYEKLYNDGFEDSVSGWSIRANDSRYAATWGVYVSSASLDRTRYLSFKCNGGPGCYIYQMTPSTPNGVTPDDLWTGEFGVRCRPAVSTVTACPVSLGLSAFGTNPTEHVSKVFSVPNDGRWHIYGLRASQFATHNQMRFYLSNDSPSNAVDVDLTTLHRSDRFV